MDKNAEIAQNVLSAVGGKENVTSVQHCMTRLRFTLKDDSIPKDDEVKKINGVLGVARSGGQYQIIIGTNVPKVYSEVCAQGGFQEKAAVEKDLDKPKEKLTAKKVLDNVMNYMSGSFTPLIPALIGAALFRTIAMVLGPSMLKLIPTDSDFYIMCDIVYDAAFYFLPIMLGYTAARKIGANPALGMTLGAALLTPDFVAMVGVRDSVNVFGFLPARVASYGQTVLPVLIAVAILYVVEKFFYKHIPDLIKTVFAPFLTLVVMVPVTFCFAAPVGSWIGTALGNALFWFADHGGFIAVAVIAAVYQFLVLVGMHHVIGTLAIAVMLERGAEFCIRPASAIANFACYGIALGAFLRMKNKEEKTLSLGYFATAFLGGVTEPTMFGVGVKYRRPFLAMAIGGFVGGLYAGITHVGCYAFASPGFLGIVAFLNGGTANTINGTIACYLALVVAAVFTYIFGGFEEGEKEFKLFRRKAAK